jgi:hypothetical protein
VIKINLKNFDKIFVLVSGGIDSTYLYEKLKKGYGNKVYPVNCFNPYETSPTLSKISEDSNFIQIKPKEKYNYGEIIKEAFLKLPEARELKKQGKYSKKIFPCCYYIKHKAFLNDKQFQEDNTVVISGIKRGDGTQRRIWLTQLSQGREPCNQSEGKPTFFHKHKGGQLYYYPFRDYKWRELPDICIRRLRKKYPNLQHSGCQICPVLVLFNLTDEKERYIKSIEYANKLGL